MATGKQKDAMLKKIKDAVLALADVYDAENHGKAHVPGAPCLGCIGRAMANALYDLKVSSLRGVLMGVMIEEARVLMVERRYLTDSEFNCVRFDLICAELSQLILDERTRTGDSTTKLRDSCVATLLSNLGVRGVDLMTTICPKVIENETEDAVRAMPEEKNLPR